MIMSEGKFTGGYWDIVDYRRSTDNPRELLEIVTFDAGLDKMVCVARIDHRVNKQVIDTEDIANANLIAAAPDMYEALDTQCEYCVGKEATDCPCERCITGKALRKAGGEE